MLIIDETYRIFRNIDFSVIGKYLNQKVKFLPKKNSTFFVIKNV